MHVPIRPSSADALSFCLVEVPITVVCGILSSVLVYWCVLQATRGGRAVQGTPASPGDGPMMPAMSSNASRLGNLVCLRSQSQLTHGACAPMRRLCNFAPSAGRFFMFLLQVRN